MVLSSYKSVTELNTDISFHVDWLTSALIDQNATKEKLYVFTRHVWLTIRAKQTDRIPLPEPTSRALAPSYSWSCRSSRA